MDSITDVESVVVDPEAQNQAIGAALYKCLAEGHSGAVAKLLAGDVEWWFHGPPQCQHMMRKLTGECGTVDFMFEPRTITAIGDCVIVEGWEGAQVYWVHVWTFKNGLITHFREYFNTCLLVTDLRPAASHDRLTLWQTQPRHPFTRSLPALVLAL